MLAWLNNLIEKVDIPIYCSNLICLTNQIIKIEKSSSNKII